MSFCFIINDIAHVLVIFAIFVSLTVGTLIKPEIHAIHENLGVYICTFRIYNFQFVHFWNPTLFNLMRLVTFALVAKL